MSNNQQLLGAAICWVGALVLTILGVLWPLVVVLFVGAVWLGYLWLHR